MIKILVDAEKYIADLFTQQDSDDLGLKVSVARPGSASALVSFNFCYPKELGDSFEKFPYQGFDVYIAIDEKEFLRESEVDLREEHGIKKLTITAPHAKGKPPADDAPLVERIRYILEGEISPQLAAHGGFVELVKITDNKDVVLNFGGGCQGCSSVKMTLKNGVEKQLKDRFQDEINSVLDSTDHSDRSAAYM